MEHESNLGREVDQLKKQVRVLSYVLGISVIIIALILTYTLPSVIQNNTFRVQWRVHHEGESMANDSADMDMDMSGGMDMSENASASSSAAEAAESAP